MAGVKKQAVTIVGGIDPRCAYSLDEFRLIVRISRQKLSDMRRAGLIIRDAGVPTVLGQDWLNFLASRPNHVAKPRGNPHGRKKPAAVGTGNEASA